MTPDRTMHSLKDHQRSRLGYTPDCAGGQQMPHNVSESHNPSTTRQESKNAGNHKQQDIGESKSTESYKATTRMESKNTKFSGFHIC